MKISSLIACLGLVVSSVTASDGRDLRGLQRQAGTRTLYPTHPPGHNATDLVHLEPNLSHALHFREAGKLANDISAFGHMVTNFQHPTVILDHSVHIFSVRCSAAGLAVHFSNAEAAKHARTQWHIGYRPLVVSTHHVGCGAYDEGARSYWSVSAVKFNNKHSAFLTASEVPLEKAIQDFDLEFRHSSLPTEDNGSNGRRSAETSSSASDPREDIADNTELLSYFFGTQITSDYPEDSPEATPVQYNGTVTERRWWNPFRSFINAIVSVVKTVADVIVKGVETIVKTGEKIVEKVIQAGKEIGKLIQDPLGYEWSLGNSFSRSFDIGGQGTRLVPTSAALFGEGSGLVISSTGVGPTVSCENCYAKGEMHMEGRIAFSIREGMTKGYMNVGGHWDSRLALGMRLEGQKKVEKIKKQLLAKNLVNLEIPRIISVGPMVTLSAVCDIYFNAKGAEILIGGQVTIEKGEATLDLLDKSKSGAKGFTPKVQPVAKYRSNGEVSVTLDFGLPLGIEAGVDLLNGKWKKTVGLFEQPSFQVRATAPTKNCQGIEIGLAIKNYVFISVGAVYDYALLQTDIWKKNLGCIRTSPQKTLDATVRHPSFKHIPINVPKSNGTNLNPGQAVNRTFGGGVSSNPPVSYPVPVNVTTVEPLTGFSYRLVTDIKQEAIMIAGREDRIYLAPYGDPDADLGAPWAYLPRASNSILIGDVFGGYLNYNPEEMNAFGASNLRSSRLTNLPVGSKFVMLAEVHDSELGSSSGMYMGVDGDKLFALVTCSVINMGTRVYLIDVNTDALSEMRDNKMEYTVVGGRVRNCQYLYLTSGIKGLTLGGNSSS